MDTTIARRSRPTARGIAPHVRVTPMIEVRGTDFELGDVRLSLKLE